MTLKTLTDGRTVDLDGARVWQDDTYEQDGHVVSRSTRNAWDRESLYLVAGIGYVLCESQWCGTDEMYTAVSEEWAQGWLRSQGHV